MNNRMAQVFIVVLVLAVVIGIFLTIHGLKKRILNTFLNGLLVLIGSMMAFLVLLVIYI